MVPNQPAKTLDIGLKAIDRDVVCGPSAQVVYHEMESNSGFVKPPYIVAERHDAVQHEQLTKADIERQVVDLRIQTRVIARTDVIEEADWLVPRHVPLE